MQLEACPWCKALVPDASGPTHRYMESSPGCWAAYGEILAREYSDPLFAKNHRLTVDAYAAQHPGKPSPQSIRSVWLHLVSLQLVLERGIDQVTATESLQRMAAAKVELPWLEPPVSLGELNVNDVLEAASAREHCRAVHAWAESVWQAWAGQHDVIRDKGSRVLPGEL